MSGLVSDLYIGLDNCAVMSEGKSFIVHDTSWEHVLGRLIAHIKAIKTSRTSVDQHPIGTEKPIQEQKLDLSP